MPEAEGGEREVVPRPSDDEDAIARLQRLFEKGDSAAPPPLVPEQTAAPEVPAGRRRCLV